MVLTVFSTVRYFTVTSCHYILVLKLSVLSTIDVKLQLSALKFLWNKYFIIAL